MAQLLAGLAERVADVSERLASFEDRVANLERGYRGHAASIDALAEAVTILQNRPSGAQPKAKAPAKAPSS